MNAPAATVSYRKPSGTWTHLPADREAENRRLARRWDRAVYALALLDQADTAAANTPKPVREHLAASRHLVLDPVLAALNLTAAEHAEALAEARRLDNIL